LVELNNEKSELENKIVSLENVRAHLLTDIKDLQDALQTVPFPDFIFKILQRIYFDIGKQQIIFGRPENPVLRKDCH